MPPNTDLLKVWLEEIIQQHARTSDVQTTCVNARAPGRNRNRAVSDSSVAPPTVSRQHQPLRSARTDEDVPTGRLSQLHLNQSMPFPSLPPPPVVTDTPSSSPDWELQSTTSAPISATRPTTYSAASGSQKGSRSRSPVKSPLDLQFTTKPLRYEPALPAVSATSSILSNVDKSLLRDLKKIATGQGTIPRSVQHEVEGVLGELDEVMSWMLKNDDEDGIVLPGLRREFDDVKDLVARSIECDVMEMSEAAWNTDVHMPLLHLALRGSPAVGAYNITTARPCRELLPKSLAVEESEAKLVDLSINVRPEMEPAVAEHIRLLLAAEPVALRTINQSLYKLLCWRPSAVCIETKGAASGGANELEARSQLLQWTSAWLTRMRRFLSARSVDQIEADATMAKLGFPVIIVSCSAWHLYLIKDTSAAVTMYSILELGDTHSVLGIYKLLSSLQRLAEWAKGPFWSWFKQDILAFQAQ
ncbi:hypothetical protein B0T16DRAFT_179710 [Cercophora newfieldiana]|uniref:PD-(D/E)XK nuclease-like domain-containing protein n=1 Tax=Cercophora newfieldiana TaxID=92897 RepID=A0AA40CLY8_9PEZI|nr:hypothetical protein B0T16DRAFT_179710 [Cercophora newfieldiana]